jgi:hypothetical protein
MAKRTKKAACKAPVTPRRRHALYFDGSKPFGETKQSHKRECDINTIVRKHIDFGTPLPESPPAVFADVTGFSFEQSLNVQREVTEAFYELPADIRMQFANNPAAYVDWCHDNKDAIDDIGMKGALLAAVDVDGSRTAQERDYGKFRRQEDEAVAEIEQARESEQNSD